MTKRQISNLFIILISIVICYDIIIPIIVYLTSPRIISYFVNGELSPLDLIVTFGIYIVSPKIVALFASLLLAMSWSRSNIDLRTIKLSYLKFISNILTIILFAITLRIVLMVLINGYSLDIALNYRSGYIVKFIYIITTLSIDILMLSKGTRGNIFRVGDFIFFVNQIILLDKLMLGVIIFCKIAVILVYSKESVQRNSKNWKAFLSIFMFLTVLAAIYSVNRIIRGDDESVFLDVLYGYLVAPVIYLYSYINHPLDTTYLTDIFLYAIHDNSLSRALFFFQGFIPNYDAFFNTFELSRSLGLNGSYNIFRFGGVRDFV